MTQYNVAKVIRMTPKVNKMDIPKATNISEKLDEIINKVKQGLNKNFYDTGYVESFAENFENNNKMLNARSISLCVERDESIKGNALLLLSILPQNSTTAPDATCMLTCGSKDVIAEYLNSSNLKEEIMKALDRLSKSFNR